MIKTQNSKLCDRKWNENMKGRKTMKNSKADERKIKSIRFMRKIKKTLTMHFDKDSMINSLIILNNRNSCENLIFQTLEPKVKQCLFHVEMLIGTE